MAVWRLGGEGSPGQMDVCGGTVVGVTLGCIDVRRWSGGGNPGYCEPGCIVIYNIPIVFSLSFSLFCLS